MAKYTFDFIISNWRTLDSDDDATFDMEFAFDAALIEPMLTHWTNPGMGISVNEDIPFNHDHDSVSGDNAMNNGILAVEVSPGFLG